MSLKPQEEKTRVKSAEQEGQGMPPLLLPVQKGTNMMGEVRWYTIQLGVFSIIQ
jgi:hypothetical protein